jgi:hypothetical protein
LAFSSRFDCWDRARSRYNPDPLEIGEAKLYSVGKYVLDVAMLSETPLAQRLLFQMGGTNDALVFCHRTLAPIFRRGGNSGAAVTPLEDY